MILPADFGVPPLPYVVSLVVAIGATLGALYFRRPRVTAATVAALAPWIAAGGTLYALYQADAVAPSVAPLFGSPAVYGTVGVLAGLVWAAVADRPSDTWGVRGAPAVLAGFGTVLLLGTLAIAAVVPTSTVEGTTPVGS